MRKVFRTVSLIMLIIAVIFIICALSNPTLGQTLYIGNFEFGVKQWYICYGIYAFIMLALFISSFFFRRQSKK